MSFFHFRRLRNDYNAIEPYNLIGICQTARTTTAAENSTLQKSTVLLKGILISLSILYNFQMSVVFLIPSVSLNKRNVLSYFMFALGI